VDVNEMVALLEGFARDEDVAASTRVRAVEVLIRLDRTEPQEDREWEAIVSRFGLNDRAK
jgi:hypothetical protein